MKLKKLPANKYKGTIVLTMNGEATIFPNQAAFVRYVYSACELLFESENSVKTEDDLIEWFVDGSDAMIYSNAKTEV